MAMDRAEPADGPGRGSRGRDGLLAAVQAESPPGARRGRRIAGSYLDALIRQDDEAAKKLGTIEEPPAIRSVRGVVHQKVRDR